MGLVFPVPSVPNKNMMTTTTTTKARQLTPKVVRRQLPARIAIHSSPSYSLVFVDSNRRDGRSDNCEVTALYRMNASCGGLWMMHFREVCHGIIPGSILSRLFVFWPFFLKVAVLLEHWLSFIFRIAWKFNVGIWGRIQNLFMNST